MENTNNPSPSYSENTLKPIDDFDSPVAQLSVSSILDNIATMIRIVTTLVGLFLLIWGVIYSIRIFNDVYTGIQGTMQNPAQGQAIVDNVANLIGGKELFIRVEGEDHHVDKILAVLFIILGVSILAQLALGIANCGAKIIMYTSSDREAIKKILKYTFSPLGVVQPSPQSNPKSLTK